MNGYKIGIRSEHMEKSVHFGIGYVWYTEKALVLGFWKWEIYIGQVYELED